MWLRILGFEMPNTWEFLLLDGVNPGQVPDCTATLKTEVFAQHDSEANPKTELCAPES